ncbi:MAG: hypothetical protein ACLQVI_39170 [Polyangiaceae bacterium]
MKPVFVAVNVERGPLVSRWDVSERGEKLVQVVTQRGDGAVRVILSPLPRTGRTVSETGSEGHAAFHAAVDWYDWVAATDPGSFPAIDLEDWREIEDALDAVRALDVA